MKYPVRLFLGDMEVEFSTPPEILFNYNETELTNPTIIKNSYSKTVTIEGTPNNNRIFGHIYNLERILADDGTSMGTSFNPLVKTDFTLYYNGSIYESGYFKLDEIRRNDNNIEYDITLYGGLGDFFYNLSYKEDGNNMELADLLFENEENTGEELGFTINKDAIHDAWLYLWQPSSKWDTINFAPCYNGKPANFTCDKFLINNSGITMFNGGSTAAYSLGTSKHEHTEWETFDLRSYLQRPVLRVRETLKAIANPENNGGYTVNLDEDFFNTDNPYYWDAWMTLPMLYELDVPATVESTISVDSLTKESTYVYSVWSDMGNATNVAFDMGVRFTPTDSYTGNSIYLIRSYWSDGGITLRDDLVKAFCSDTMITIQMYGYNDSGQIAATSDMYYLTSWVADEFYFKNSTDLAKEVMMGNAPQTTSAERPTQPETEINNIILSRGKFTKKNGVYVWTNENGTEQTLKFRFPANTELTQLKLKIVVYNRDHVDRTWWGGDTNTQSYGRIDAWSEKVVNDNTYHGVDYIKNLKKVTGTFSYVPKGATGTTVSYDGFYSGRKYTKQDLLTLGITPAQFLLSYSKMFGLYFIKDVESKTIDILTRHNFYQRDKIININDLIDKGSDIKIEPTSPKYQYYDFALEPTESEAGATYKKTYGAEYGSQVINTNYQYEREHKALLDKNIFKGAVNVLEKNKYFQAPTNGVPCLVYNGFSYWYTVGGTNYDGTIDEKTMSGATINPDGLRYYDRIAKAQFHKEDNEATDGAFVLLFCDGIDYSMGDYGYHITDDVSQMYTMNNGQPCWFMNRYNKDRLGNTVALDVERFPIFTRDVYRDKNVDYSFDLGTPRTLYVPNKYVTDWQSIYNKGWKAYISDLYDGNTRVLKCRCLLRERPNPDWLRRFYWFDNSYWRLNSIKDWNISSYGTTEMEFIKVQDVADYDNIEFSIFPIIEFHLDSYNIGAEGGIIDGYIYISNGTSYSTTDAIPVDYSNGSHEYWENAAWVVSPTSARGSTKVPIRFTIPANTSAYTRTINYDIEDSYDHFHGVSIEQGSGFTGQTMVLGTTTFPKSGGTYNATVVSTENNWHIEYPSWAVPSVTSGSAGKYEITIRVYSNGTTNTRTGNIRIGNTTIPITQYGQ